MLFIHTVRWTHTTHSVLECPLPPLHHLTPPTKTNGNIHHTAWCSSWFWSRSLQSRTKRFTHLHASKQRHFGRKGGRKRRGTTASSFSWSCCWKPVGASAPELGWPAGLDFGQPRRVWTEPGKMTRSLVNMIFQKFSSCFTLHKNVGLILMEF